MTGCIEQNLAQYRDPGFVLLAAVPRFVAEVADMLAAAVVHAGGVARAMAGSAAHATSALLAMSPLWETSGLALDLFTAPLLSMSYAVALLRAMRTRPGAALARSLAPGPVAWP